jgi:uncharacterized protein YceH (UPF0502 family)
MAMDDRIIHLVRQEVDRVLTEADAGPDSLHTELHALATKVDALTARVAALETQMSPRPARARKATDPA